MIANFRCPMSGSALYVRAKKKSHQKVLRKASSANAKKGKGKGKNHSRRSLRKQKSDPSKKRVAAAVVAAGGRRASKKIKTDLSRLKAETLSDVVVEIAPVDADPPIDSSDEDPASECDSGEEAAFAACEESMLASVPCRGCY